MASMQIGLIGDYQPDVTAHKAIPLALELAAKALGLHVAYEWLATPTLEPLPTQRLEAYNGFWCVPATPYESLDGALNGIRFAREHDRPFLGTCGGFQHAVLEFARNVLGWAEADHAESNPETTLPVISPLTCSMNELTNTFTLVPDSRIAKIYGQTEVVEQYGTCNFGIDPRYQALLEQGGLKVTGTDTDGAPRVIEWPERRFALATLYQPERSALKARIHPLVRAFVQASSEITT